MLHTLVVSSVQYKRKKKKKKEKINETSPNKCDVYVKKKGCVKLPFY